MNTVKINELLRQKADLSARLNLLPYEGTPEIKENKSGKYLYVRRREMGKLKSIYVGTFSDDGQLLGNDRGTIGATAELQWL